MKIYFVILIRPFIIIGDIRKSSEAKK